MLAILDGDILAFRASAAIEQNIDWGDGESGKTLTADPSAAARAALKTADAWAEIARADRVHIAFTGRHNFRKVVLPTYKHNRAGAVKPQAYIYTVNELRDHYDTTLVEGLEADDIMGIMATRPSRVGKAVIVTLDKDLRTVPGLHLNPLKEDRPIEVSLPAADYKWLTQTLTGDVTDGYSGCPRIGPKKAAQILGDRPWADVARDWPKVTATYAKAGKTAADALQQARVARILRHGEYEKTTRSIRLWSPQGAEEAWLKLEP